MVESSVLEFTDLGRQRRYSTDLSGDLTPRHDVEAAIDHYASSVGMAAAGQRLVAVSRGRRLDKKQLLGDLPEADSKWKVVPEATAG